MADKRLIAEIDNTGDYGSLSQEIMAAIIAAQTPVTV
jgi:hypothetical protein